MVQVVRSLTGITVLVVEDDPLIAADVVGTLQSAGAEVVGPGGSVSEAMRLMDLHPFDVALLDFRLGCETSRPIAERLEVQSQTFFFHCGSCEEVAQAFPGVMVVGKPSQPKSIITAVQTLSAGRARPH